MKKIAPIIILTILSALFIFYRFNDIPKNLSFDEVEFAKLALSLQNRPYTPYSTLATGHSTLYFYILLASLKTFGINTFALRFPAAIFGILSVLLFYLIMKRVFQKQIVHLTPNTYHLTFIPFFFALILLSSRWFLNFSRFSFEATFLLFLELMSIYFLLLADAKMTNFFATLDLATAKRLQRSQKKLTSSISSNFYLIISGLFAGLAFLSYTPGRIFFLLPMGFLLFRKQFNNKTMRQLLLFIIPFIITVTPLTLYFSTHIDTRIDQQFFLMNHEMPIQEKLTGLWHNVSTTALMFNIKGDINGRHNYPGKPALNPILGLLFTIGLVITMKQWNNNNNKLFLIYFFLSLLPALSTYPWENPNILRTFTVIPAIVYFAGQSLLSGISLFDKSKNKTSVLLILMAFVTVSFFYELRTYFKYQSQVFKESFEIYNPLEKELKVNKKL